MGEPDPDPRAARRARVEARVAEYVERSELGERLDAAAFAAETPELAEELLAALGELSSAEALFPARPSGSPADLPASVGRFRVLTEIGRGGMGRVLRVEDPERPGAELALKLMHVELAWNPRALERFRREGAALGRVEHPGVVRVLEADVLGSSPYLLMELVEGASLGQTIAAARGAAESTAPAERLDLPGEGPGWRRAARVVAALARAVDALHRGDVLHRDLKPANVILAPDGRPVLIDLGMVGGFEPTTLTRTGDLLGTPQYMAPEQARGEAADVRSDVYGLGTILYELLTLEPPHTGDDPLLVIESVRRRPVPAVARRAQGVPAPLAEIVRRALAHQRRFRTRDAALLAEQLERLCAGEAPGLPPTSLHERLSDLWTFRRRPISYAAAALGVIALLVLVALRAGGDGGAARAAALREALLAWADVHAADRVARVTPLVEDWPAEPWGPFLLADVSEDSSAPTSTDPAVAAVLEGLSLEAADDAPGAITSYRRAVGLAPQAPVPVVLLARAAEQGGDLEQARSELTAAVRLLPGSARLQFELARVEYYLRDLEAAEATVQHALELDGEDPHAWEILARIRHRREQWEAGLEASTRALEFSGGEPTSSILNTHGCLLSANGRYDEARETFRSLSGRDPGHSNAFLNSAASYDKQHRAREAEEAYWVAVEHDAEGKALASLAWLYSGGKLDCEECRAVYVSDPELLDPVRAEACALAAVDVDRGKSPGIVMTAAVVAERVDRRERMVEVLEELRDASEEDAHIANLARALRVLR